MNSITIHVEQREDGGLRVFSDELPGLVLSHNDAKAVLHDIGPAVWEMLDWEWPSKDEPTIFPHRADG